MNQDIALHNSAESRSWYIAYLFALLASMSVVACAPAASTPRSDTVLTGEPSVTPFVTNTIAPPDEAVATPKEPYQVILVSEPTERSSIYLRNLKPRGGSPLDVPDVWVVPSRQSKEELASHLKTDVAQLDWVNPGLPNRLTPGTLVIIPPGYFAQTDMTFSDISKLLGIPLATLLEANPNRKEHELVLAGQVVAVPSLHFVTTTTDIFTAAEDLDVSQDALLSANPHLLGSEAISKGTVLIVPLGDSSR